MTTTRGITGATSLLKTDPEIEANLRSLVRDRKLRETDINTNFVVALYLREFHNTVLVSDGQEHGLGWISKELPNFETIRLAWAKLRNQTGIHAGEEFKQSYT